jgi:hypothetical protein
VTIKNGSIKVGNGSRVIYDVLEKKVILKVQGLFKIFLKLKDLSLNPFPLIH